MSRFPATPFPLFSLRGLQRLALLLFVGCAHRTEWQAIDDQAAGVAAWVPPSLPKPADHFVVNWISRGAQGVLDLELQGVPRIAAISRILEESTIPYRLHNISALDPCDLRLKAVPILTALNILLRDSELECSLIDQNGPLLTIQERQSPLIRPQFARPDEPTSTCSYTPTHQSAQKLYELILRSSNSSSGLLTSSSLPAEAAASIEGNQLFFRGHPACITRLLRMVRSADIPPIRLRAEIYTYARRPITQQLETSSDLSVDQGKGSLAVNLSEGGSLGATDLLSLGWNDVASSMQQATLKAVEKRRLSQYLAGTEITVANGESFFIQAGKTGYILIPQFFNGTPATISQAISTGNSWKVTPLMLPDGSVRMQMEIDASRFSDNPPLFANIINNTRSLTVQVPLNTLMAIQGLTRPSSSIRESALAPLRNLPVIGYFVSRTNQREELDLDLTLLRVSRVEEGNLSPLPPIAQEIALPACDESEGLHNSRSF